jgi:uncharacterized membrane protein
VQGVLNTERPWELPTFVGPYTQFVLWIGKLRVFKYVMSIEVNDCYAKSPIQLNQVISHLIHIFIFKFGNQIFILGNQIFNNGCLAGNN